VQANVLLKDNTFYVNGGAPVGIVALSADNGGDPRLVSQGQPGMEMFLTADGQPLCIGPELFSHELARTEDLKNSGKIGNVVQVLLGAGFRGPNNAADVCGLAVGSDGLVVLHRDSMEGISRDGRSLWTASLPSPPVRWGVALAGKQCLVTLTDGHVMCFGEPGLD
jgi:hypothetical protein